MISVITVDGFDYYISKDEISDQNYIFYRINKFPEGHISLRPESTYIVKYSKRFDRFSCDCPAGSRNVLCKHLAMAMKYK